LNNSFENMNKLNENDKNGEINNSIEKQIKQKYVVVKSRSESKLNQSVKSEMKYLDLRNKMIWIQWGDNKLH